MAELTGGTPRFLDPFHDWQELSTEECARIVRSLQGTPLVASHLAPTPPGPVVLRMLTNLTNSYLLRESLTDALWTVELALIVKPDDVELAAQREAILRAIDASRRRARMSQTTVKVFAVEGVQARRSQVPGGRA